MNALAARRAPLGFGFGLLLALAAQPARAQDTVVEGQLEVIEVGVLADLPASLRGRSAAELGQRIAIVEDGVERAPVSVASVGGGGTDAYGRVLVVVDVARCNSEILRFAPAALGAEAERLTALGPVSIALYRDGLEPVAGPTRSVAATSAALARIVHEVRCGPPPADAELAQIALADDALACPARPCLLAWVGPGWGGAPDAAGAPPSASTVEPLARRLAGLGWTLLATPIDRATAVARKRSAPEPEYRPESGTYRFGINVLGGRRDRAPLSAEEYSKFVDVWLAPLRRLSAATAGEFVVTGDALAGALDALAGRSILYYRSERKASDEPPTLIVRAPGETGRSFRTPEWAPIRVP